MQKAEDIKFSKVAVDHCIEQTFNRDTNTRGGIVGFSLKKGVIEKWIPTAHARAALTNERRQLAGLKVDMEKWIPTAHARAALTMNAVS